MTDQPQNKAKQEPADKTIIEKEDKTIIESEQTVRETADWTVAESDDSLIQQKSAATSDTEISSFRNYPILHQLPATGGEADIYIIKQENTDAILKLYRLGIDPKEEVLKRAKELSDQFPEHIVGIYEYGYDEKTKRWYEIQEYAKYGSLRDYINTESENKDLSIITEEIAEGLKVLNDNNLLHLDLKPANILVRSKEPFDLIFSDFGIASIIAPEQSKKEMSKLKGTVLYWAPESLAGIVGKPMDYWSLGMILLEIMAGIHPFSGLDTRVIMYTLSTKGVHVPDDLPEDYKLLLKGLLTREPEKRWGYQEVRRWLNGERDIPFYYIYEERKEGQYEKPYSFNDKKHYTLEELMAAFVESEESWRDAVSHINRGYVTKWLENNADYDNSVKIEKIREEAGRDSDLILLTIIYNFNKGLPFIFHGKLITIQNLHLYTGKTLRKEQTNGEGEVTDALVNGKLLEYYRRYLQLVSKDMDDLYELFVSLNKAMPSEKEYSDKLTKTFHILDFLLSIHRYTLPSDIVEKPFEELEFLIENLNLFMKRKEYKDLIDAYIMPEMIISTILFGESSLYINAIKLLIQLNESQLMLRKDEFNTLKNEYIIPNEIIISVESETTDLYINAAKYLRGFQKENLLIKKQEYADLTNNFILPEEIKSSLLSEKPAHYEAASRKLRKWQNDAILVKRVEYEGLINNYVVPRELKNGMVSNDSSQFEIAAYHLKKIRGLILSKADHREITNKFLLPDKLKNDVLSDKTSDYESAVNFLRKAQTNNHLITKNERDDIIREYFIPDALQKDLTKCNDTLRYEKAIILVRKLQENNLLIKKKEFKKIIKKYILHKELKQDLFSRETERFVRAFERFRQQQASKQLIERSQTINRFIKYGAIGIVIGIALRGILVVAGYKDWLFYYYDHMTWMEIWDKDNFETGDFMVAVVFYGICGCMFWIYKIMKK